MALQYSPKIVQDGLVMCLDPSQNTSFPSYDLPVKNGLLVWLDASDDTTFSYSSGTTVSQWRDKSGFNYHMVPVSAGPTRNAFLNSRKVIACTASQQIWNSSINLVTSPYTIFCVTRLTGTTNSRVLSTSYTGATGTNWLLGHWGGWVNQYYAEGWVTGPYSPGSVANTAWNVFMGDWSGASTDLANLYTNGTAITTNSNGANAGPLGLGINISSEASTCEAAEIIVFNRVLSTKERNLIHTYLGLKWGISNTDRSIINLSNDSKNGLFGEGTSANMPYFSNYNKGFFNFDGSNDYIFLQNDTALDTQSPTVEVWVRTNALSQNGFWFEKGSVNTQYALFQEGAYIQWRLNLGGTIYTLSTNASSYMDTNNWFHVVGTYTSGNRKLYINGVLVNSDSQTGTINTNTYGMNIGRHSAGYYYSGSIASVKVYSKALSAAEVAQNYEAQKTKFANTIVQNGLILNLDAGNPYSYAGAGTTWYDTSGAVNDFTIANSPTYSTNEFVLNGSTQFFYNVSAASGFFISSTNNFYADVGYAWTISVWFKFPISPTNLRDGTNNGGNCSYCMVGNGGGIGGAETLALFVSGVGGTTAGFHPYYCIVGIRGAKTQLSAGSVNTNTWNHALVTWNGSAGRGYFNGVDVGALNIGSAGMQINGYTIGTQVGGNQGSHTYEGSLSQVFIYNRALSSTEALQNYNATKGRFGL